MAIRLPLFARVVREGALIHGPAVSCRTTVARASYKSSREFGENKPQRWRMNGTVLGRGYRIEREHSLIVPSSPLHRTRPLHHRSPAIDSIRPSSSQPFSSTSSQTSPPSPAPKTPSTSASSASGSATTTPSPLPLHENIYTLPNLLTFTRLLSTPLIGYCLIQSSYGPAFAIFVYAGLTDLVDGWMARRWQMQTVLGTILDPMADKALMTVVTVGLAVKGAVPAILATLILGRDFCLGLSALYYRYISLPAPKTFRRFWDFSLPSAEVRPTTISKYNTFLQLALLGGTMALMAVEGGEDIVTPSTTTTTTATEGEEPDEKTPTPTLTPQWTQEPLERQILQVSWWLVGITTVWSGLSYVSWGRRRGLRILSSSPAGGVSPASSTAAAAAVKGVKRNLGGVEGKP